MSSCLLDSNGFSQNVLSTVQAIGCLEARMELDWIRLTVAALLLGYGAIMDLRTRRVGNAPWLALAALGILLIPVQIHLDRGQGEYILVLVPILAIFSDVYWDGKEGSAMAKYGPPVKYAVAIVATFAIGLLWWDRPYFRHLLAIPVLMMLIVLMYMFDVIRGGADAKALLSLSVLFPFYPWMTILHGFDWTQVMMPFAFVVLVNAAIITAISPLYFIMKNLSSGDFAFPQAFLGYKMESKSAKGKHVWLMERMEAGRHILFTRPKKAEDLNTELDLLAKAGHDRVWVTPKIPFILPMFVSLIFSAIVGNVLVLVIL